MHTKRVNSLVRRIRENMMSASAEQKARFATLLEQIMTREQWQPTAMTVESLTEELKYLEKVLPAAKRISREALYELHEFEMKLRGLIPDGSLNQQGRVYDVAETVQEAISAVDLLQTKVSDIENTLVKSIQSIGWDIKDLQDEQNFAEAATQPMSELERSPRDNRRYVEGYRCYQSGNVMKNPYDESTAESRDWADGYHQAVIDQHQKTTQ